MCLRTVDKRLPGIRGIIICLLVSCSIAYFLYNNKVEYWKEQAAATFHQALKLELQKRDTVLVFHKEAMGYSSLSLNESFPQSITIVDDSGERVYIIPREKYEHSFVQEKLQKSILSILLEDYPLDSDTLNAIWDSLLVATDIPVKKRTRISVTDFQEHVSVSCSKDSLEFCASDSLSSYYLGERCEVEVTGFVSYGLLEAFGYFEYCLIFLSCILSFSLLWRGKNVAAMFMKHEPVTKEIVQPVITVRVEDSHVYQLEEGVFFDTKENTLKSAIQTKKLSPQIAFLLKLFLSSKKYQLSVAEMDKKLCPDGSGTKERIYTVTRRLRQSLASMTHLTVWYENGVYQLKKNF